MLIDNSNEFPSGENKKNSFDSANEAKGDKGSSHYSEQEYRRADIRIKSLSLIGIFVAAISILISFICVRQDHVWDRNRIAFDILRNFNQEVVPVAQMVMRTYPYHRDSLAVISNSLAKEIYNADAITDSAKYILRGELIYLCNYMKAICIAYDNDVVDKKMIKREFNALFNRWEHCFGSMMAYAQFGYGVKGQGPYYIVYEVLDEWKEK
jgi:hypothetical protein